MKKGFTMIELIFVIVILGILAAVAIPKLAATRDDAKLAAIKTDVSTAMQAIPAWYQGQRDARIIEAVSLDTTSWVKSGNDFERYTWSEDSKVCVTLAVTDVNSSDNSVLGVAEQGTTTSEEINSSNNGRWIGDGNPVLRLVKGTLNDDGNVTVSTNISTNCAVLWDTAAGLGLSEQNISMGGKKVVW